MEKLDPWTIALYRIIDHITHNIHDPDVKNNALLKINKLVTWMEQESVENPGTSYFKKLIDLSKGRLYESYLNPPKQITEAERNRMSRYSDAIKKQKEIVASHGKGSRGVKPLSYAQMAENCVEEHLKIFFTYTIEYETDHDGKTIPALTRDHQVKFEKYPKKKARFSRGDDEKYYLAYYLRGELTPNVGMVTISWKKVGELYKPLSAILEQTMMLSEKDDSNLIKFKAKDQSEPMPKPKSNLIYFKFEVDNPKISLPIVFQCTVDFPNYLNRKKEDVQREHPMIFGTYSAIRRTDSKVPIAGGVVLVETTAERQKQDYDQIKKYIREQPLQAHDHELIADFLRANYYLTEQIITTPKLKYAEKDTVAFQGWAKIAGDLAGNYLGKIYVENEDSQVNKETFKLKINPLGHAGAFFTSTGKLYKGKVKVESDSFQVLFSDPTGPNFNFVLRHKEGNERHCGVFHGYLPLEELKTKFNFGSLILEKQILAGVDAEEINDHLDKKMTKGEFKRGVITADRDVYKEELELYQDYVSTNADCLPDGQLLKKLLLDQSPIFNNKDLSHLGLPEHMKYITFRIPEKRRFEEGIYSTMFRFEKCDLRFYNHYKDVKLVSPSSNYNGKVYFNGNVILMILNPVDANGRILYTDNFFTIQVDAHKIADNNINNINTLFGTSTWRSDEYIESKMIVLRKAEEEDTEPGIYSIGAHGIAPSEKELNVLNEQDLKYNGAFSYLCGRLNRHIHVSSGNGKKDFFRPRDPSSREPFLYAAMYLISQIKSGDRARLIAKILAFLNEAKMHQHASTHFAGLKLDDLLIADIDDITSDAEVKERLHEIVLEQDDLRRRFTEVPEDLTKVRKTMQKLWPFLEA